MKSLDLVGSLSYATTHQIYDEQCVFHRQLGAYTYVTLALAKNVLYTIQQLSSLPLIDLSASLIGLSNKVTRRL